MPTATTGATQAGCATTVMFLEDSVVLSIVQPVYGHQNRLYTQCVTKLISGSPVRRTFRFNLNNIGISDVPERSLTIKLGEEALHQMSCLADVKKNTGSAMANVGDKRKVTDDGAVLTALGSVHVAMLCLWPGSRQDSCLLGAKTCTAYR